MVLSSLSIGNNNYKVRWGLMEFGDMGRLGVIAQSMAFYHDVTSNTELGSKGLLCDFLT